MDKIIINVSYSSLIAKIKQHLAVIGKRAKDIQGNSMFSDLTTSSQEDTVLWKDFCDGGAELIVAELAQLSGGYTSSDTELKFEVSGSRWTDCDDSGITSLKKALATAITKFIWNYAIKEYLSIIHPGTGAKYPPIWGSPYEQRMQYQLKAIRELAYIKRSPMTTYEQYDTVSGEIVEDEEDNNEEERVIDYENPFDFIEKHHHRGRKGGNLPQRCHRQKHRRPGSDRCL